MHRLDAAEVAKLLHELGQRAALRGGNPYRARAYSRAAESLLALPQPLESVVGQNRLREIPGVGETIAEIVAKLHREGTHPLLEELRAEAPAGVLEMLTIPGIRADQVLKLHRELGVGSIEELEQAARENRLQGVKGMGAALQAKILQGIEIHRQGAGRRHLHRAAALLEAAEAQLRRSKTIRRVTPAGDFRRGCELVADLSLVAEATYLGGDADRISSPGQLSVQLTDGRRYGIALLLATGSEKHIEELRSLAAARGMTLDEEGLRQGEEIVAGRSEEDIYAALGLPFIAPELREGRGEVALAQQGKLPQLVADADIRGILHAHTERSDGVHTLEAMAEATCAAGYEYFGVADHSRSAHYAGGLSIDEVAEQHDEADRLNRRFGERFRIFKGIESDILPDGSLDYPGEVLASFDFVVASVHGRFRMSRKEQTERIIRAVQNPHTTILGHMTGRQLLRRPGYEVDVEKVLKACARFGVAVEINANPWRLDLDWRWHQRALELGCLMSINPDAHDTSEIALTHWGVTMARKGGVPKERVLNCLDRSGFASYLAGRAAPPRRRSSTKARPAS
jgi:DNA polymerase (family 10)